jgi:hypothetical protein
MRFPIYERTVRTRAIGVDYTLILRGNTVVSIDPPGRFRPLYQRAAFRDDKPQMITLKRFNCEQLISW